MSPNGTAAYQGVSNLPPLVARAVDLARAELARKLFTSDPGVTVLHADWRDLATHGPFGLLVLDAAGRERTAIPRPTRTCF